MLIKICEISIIKLNEKIIWCWAIPILCHWNGPHKVMYQNFIHIISRGTKWYTNLKRSQPYSFDKVVYMLTMLFFFFDEVAKLIETIIWDIQCHCDTDREKKLCSRNGMGFMRFSMGFFFYSGQYHQGIAVYAVDIRLCVTPLLGSVLCVILCASMCILQCLWITFLYDAISISCVMYWILVLCTKGKFQCINCIRDLMESFRTNCPFSKMKWFIFCCCFFALCHSLFINVWFRTEYGQDCRHPSFRVNS